MSSRSVAAITALFAVFHGFAHAQAGGEQRPQAPKVVFTCESSQAVGFHAGSTMPNIYNDRFLFKLEERTFRKGTFYWISRKKVGENEWSFIGSLETEDRGGRLSDGGMVGETFALSHDKTKFAYMNPAGYWPSPDSPYSGTPYMVIGRCFPAT